MPFDPQLPDRASRGALCERIERLAKAIMELRPDGTTPDREECARAWRQLDDTRAKLHRLYGRSPRPH